MTALTDTEMQVLAFERRFWKHRGAKDEAITVELEMTPTRYYQMLRALAGRPEALQHAPDVVNRQLRLQQQWRQARRTG